MTLPKFITSVALSVSFGLGLVMITRKHTEDKLNHNIETASLRRQNTISTNLTREIPLPFTNDSSRYDDIKILSDN